MPQKFRRDRIGKAACRGVVPAARRPHHGAMNDPSALSGPSPAAGGATCADLSVLVACPQCDLLNREPTLPDGARARCARCGTVLLAPQTGAVATVVALAMGRSC